MSVNNNIDSIKVLHCIHSVVGGGAETQLRILASHSRTAGVESYVASFDQKSELYFDNDVRLYVCLNSHKNIFKTFLFFYKTISNSNVDIVHVWLPMPVTVPAMLAAFVLRKKVVFSYRTKMKVRSVKSLVELVFAFLCSDKIISNNPLEQSSLVYRLLARIKDGYVIPNAVIQECSKVPVLGSKVKILYAGRLIKSKNVEQLVNALSQVNLDQIECLTICGVGESETELKKLVCSLNIDDKVKFVGFVDDLQSEMVNHDLFISPSLLEGMPNVVVEAMTVGLPCLISDIEPHKWIAGSEYPGLFSVSNDVSLVDKINRFLTDPGFSKILLDEGFSTADRFSLDSMLYLYDQEYRKCI